VGYILLGYPEVQAPGLSITASSYRLDNPRN